MSVSLKTWFRNIGNIVTVGYVVDRLDLRFVLDAVKQTIYEVRHPLDPWITIDMIKILENYLRQDDVGFEFGSGSSSIWLAKKTKYLTSVEHDERWVEKVSELVRAHDLDKKIKLIKVEMNSKSYVAPVDQIQDGSLDYGFVDGLYRDECILALIPKVRKGGILIVDNVDNYFPKNRISRSIRYKRDNFSKSVSKRKMRTMAKILDRWRCIWTSSAVQDTAMWIKP